MFYCRYRVEDQVARNCDFKHFLADLLKIFQKSELSV